MSGHRKALPAPLLAAAMGAFGMALWGCSDAGADRPVAPTEAKETRTPVEAAHPSSASPPAPVGDTADGATVGGDGSEIRLTALSSAEIQAARLSGELGCSFAATPAAAPILLATGNVASQEPSQGLVKVSGVVERIAAPGGFDAMVQGVTFSGRGKTIRIAMTGPAAGGGESPPRPATLTYDRADGARRSFVGRWMCGP